MSDQAPPRKIGSLRDRIAAFENNKDTQASSANNAPPPPRPKPGQIKWQPRPRSRSPPPASTHSNTHVHADVTATEHGEVGGMNPADAAESVGKMSLKERMAALQGRGGFGAPVVAPPAIQRTERKWQPPPPQTKTEATSTSEHEHEHGHGHGHVEEGEERGVRSPVRSPMSALVEIERKEEVGEEPAEDEEEERKRRAAIAARMAKLGGARLGMGPPVGAPKPVVKPHHENEEMEKSPDADAEGGEGPKLEIDLPEAPSQTSLLSESSSAKSPQASMPIPSQPRRAGPPRRRPPKSPGASGSTTDVIESGEGVDTSTATPVNEQERDERKIESEEEKVKEEEEETEEEAAARRKRIAERIAKQGGLNFLAAPRPVEDEEEEGEECEHHAETEEGVEHEHQHSADADAEAEDVGGEGEVAEVEVEGEGNHEFGVEGQDQDQEANEHEQEQDGEEQEHDLHEDVEATVAHLQHDSDLDGSYSYSPSGLETASSSVEPSGGLSEESIEEEEAPPGLPPKRDAHVPFPKTTDEVEFPSKESVRVHADKSKHEKLVGEEEEEEEEGWEK